jgi:Fe-S cluster assembly protein SufD
MSAALLARLKDEYGAVRDALPAAVIGGERRREAIEALCAQGLPATREENWRYANLRVLERARFSPVASRAGIADLPAPLAGFARLVFVDGVLAAGAPVDRTGLVIHSLRSGAPLGAACEPQPIAALPETRLALLNEGFATDGAAIRVRREAGTPHIELLFIASSPAQAGSSYPRVQLSLEAGARLTLVERHVSAGDEASLINCAVRADLAAGARLDHYRLQQTSARAAWFDTLEATLAQDARYSVLAVSAGALAARSTVHIRLTGAAAEVALSAAGIGNRQQSQDTYALSEHMAPRTRTEQIFRGIASGRARVAFSGKIAVRENARGTDSRQSLRGLLAGPEAEIDVRPQLEIYTDEVRCSHGATAGKLDENMFFYLLSRGLAPEVAQRLLKWAFLEDVVSRIELPEVRQRIEHELAGQMSDLAPLKELLR